MVSLKIDGIEVQVEPGKTILDAAKKAGVNIPVLCHDDRLNPFGACRLCLVEAVGNPRLMTACTTPAGDKMDIITNSEKLQGIRKTLMELLLVNHPLECPVCDKGGECGLQDLTYEMGVGKVRFDEKPADTPVDHSNPFIERDIDRCVLCGRCVRICDEVVNIQAISFINRGVDTYIGTAFDQPWDCEFCGQCMSVCPVGSLNNRVYLFKNRPWNMKRETSVCGLCSCGCTIEVDHEGNEIMRVETNDELGVNHGYLCAKGRFGFELANASARKKTATVKSGSEKKDASPDEAAKILAENLKSIKDKHGAGAIGFVVSPRLTNEEAYAVQKLARTVIGTNNVYSFESVESLPEGTLADVEASDAVCVMNIDVTEANPILGLAVRHAARMGGARLGVFYPSHTALRRVATDFVTGAPKDLYAKMDAFVKALGGEKNECSDLADAMKKAERPVVVYNPYNEFDLKLVAAVKEALPSVKLVAAKAKNNSQGILDMGCANGVGPGLVSVEKGVDLEKGLADGSLKALVVFGENFVVRPEGVGMKDALKKLELLAVMDPFTSETAEMADIHIPTATFFEKPGTFTNLEGRVQAIAKVIDKDVPNDFRVVKLIAEAMNAEIGECIMCLRGEIGDSNPLYKGIDWNGGLVKYPYALNAKGAAFKMAGKGGFALYPASLRLHSGTFTRKSPDLAKAYAEPMMLMNTEDAEKVGVADGASVKLTADGISRSFRIKTVSGMTKGTVSMPSDYPETADIFAKGVYLNVELGS